MNRGQEVIFRVVTKYKTLILYFACLFLFVNNGFAIVNIEDERIEKPEEGLSGNVKISLKKTSGNTEKENIEGGSRIVYVKENFQSLFLFSREYAIVNQAKNTDQTFSHLRLIYETTALLSLEVFYQVERDEFLYLKSRELLGIGGRFELQYQPKSTFHFLGVGIFSENEEYIDAEDKFIQKNRANVYWVYKKNLFADDSLQFANTLYYQPNIEENSDYRVLDDLGFSFKIHKAFKFNINIKLRHNSIPYSDLKETDLSITQNIQYNF